MNRLISISRNPTAAAAAYQADCQNCGACCSFFAREEGMITADGPAAQNRGLSCWHEDKHVNQWPDGDREEIDNSRFVMRTKTLGDCSACIALEGAVGQRVTCAIYEERPSQCRAFEPGNVLCLAARERAGIPPLHTENR